MNATEDIDFAFRHHLRSTILLLGGKLEIAEMLNKSKDLKLTQADLDRLMQYNIDLFGQAKDRLAHLSVHKIIPTKPE